MKILVKTPKQLIVQYSPSLNSLFWLVITIGIGAFLFHKPLYGAFLIVSALIMTRGSRFTKWDFNKENNELTVIRQGGSLHPSTEKFSLDEIENIQFNLWENLSKMSDIIVLLSNGRKIHMLDEQVGLSPISQEDCQKVINEISEFLK